jgi:hypothetical protein
MRISLVLSCLTHASCWANAPRWGGRLRCWPAAPLPLPQTWTCCAVQIATRVPLSLYLGPRLVNVVSLCANDPTPCTCKTNYLRILMLFNIFLHSRRSFASSCATPAPATHSTAASPAVPPCVPLVLPLPLLLSRVRTHRRRTARRQLPGSLVLDPVTKPGNRAPGSGSFGHRGCLVVPR